MGVLLPKCYQKGAHVAALIPLPLSQNKEKRKNQLANLKPYEVREVANLK